MKIVHLIFSLETGGAENLLIDLANDQSATEQVSIIAINNRINLSLTKRISASINFYCLRRKPGSSLNVRFLFKLWYYLFKIQPDVIHCHNHNNIGLIPFWRKKAVITVHDVQLNASEKLKKYHRVFSISRSVKLDILRSMQVDSTIVYNGMYFNGIKTRSNYGYNGGDKIRIIQIGRLAHEVKGQHIAIEAFNTLVNEFGVKDIELYMAGEGPSQAFLKLLIKETNLENNVFLLGNKEKDWVNTNLCNYHLLIQPSLNEGFGLTLLEAITAGVPVVASDIDGPSEILENVPSAFLFKPVNAETLANTILKVVEIIKSGKLKTLCERSYQMINPKYSISNTSREYIKQYKSLAEKSEA